MTAARAPPCRFWTSDFLRVSAFALCSANRNILTMNTIKSILLGTTLLLLTGLCGQPVHADATYTAIASGVTPQSGSYPINHGYMGSSTTPASIPIAVTQLSVKVTGATPSSNVYVGWSMLVKVTVHTPSGSHAGTTLDQDASNGMVSVVTQPDGSWHHNWKGGADGTTAPNFSLTMTTTTAGNWIVEADSTITDSHGVNTLAPAAYGSFTTVDEYMI